MNWWRKMGKNDLKQNRRRCEGTLDYYSSIFAGRDFSETSFSLWKLIETNFHSCTWKTFSVPFYPSLFLLKKNLSVIQRLPLPCPAWLHHGFAMTGCKKSGKTCSVCLLGAMHFWSMSSALQSQRPEMSRCRYILGHSSHLIPESAHTIRGHPGTQWRSLFK